MIGTSQFLKLYLMGFAQFLFDRGTSMTKKGTRKTMARGNLLRAFNTIPHDPVFVSPEEDVHVTLHKKWVEYRKTTLGEDSVSRKQMSRESRRELIYDLLENGYLMV